MSGTKEGGRKARDTNYAKYGPDFYRNVGKQGWKNPYRKAGGFATLTIGKDGLTGPQRAVIAGAKGGAKSKRGPKKLRVEIH